MVSEFDSLKRGVTLVRHVTGDADEAIRQHRTEDLLMILYIHRSALAALALIFDS